MRTGSGAAYREWSRRLCGAAARWPENLVLVSSVPSTQSLGRAVAEEYLREENLPRRCLVTAWEQTAGRGRRNRSWSSPAGRGVYATWIEPLADRRRKWHLPLLVPVALMAELTELIAAELALKWPNDIVDDDGRKLGGILIDALDHGDGGGVALIGFGVNHGPPGQAAATPRNATSLAELGTPPALGEVTARLVRALRDALDADWSEDELVRRYCSLSVHRPGDRLAVRVGEDRLEGAFAGFDPQGRIRLQVGESVRHIASGEVFRL